MTWKKIAALCLIWCGLALVPALAAHQALASGTGGTATGWVAGIWIVGYICQFVFFIGIGRSASVGTGVGRVLAALLPWLADWMALVSPWWVVPFAVILLGYSGWLSRSVYQVDVLRRDGIEGSGLVLEVIRPTLNVVLKNDKTRRSMRVEVTRPDGEPRYEASFDSVFTVGAIPEPGDILGVRIDPGRPQHVELIEDVPVHRAATNTPDLDPETAERLHMLTTMRDRGDLTDDEYTAARARLLDPN